MISFNYADSLTPKQLEQIDALADACIRYEGLTLGRPQLSGEDALVYLYYESRKKDVPKSVLIAYVYDDYAEVSAFTDPSCRCRGYFTSLFERFLSENDGLSVCFYPDGCSYDALAAMDALECEYTGTERLMECSLDSLSFDSDTDFPCSLKACDDIAVLAPIHSDAFGLSVQESTDFLTTSVAEDGAVAWLIRYNDEPVGLCLGTADGDSVYLFGLCIHPKFQRRSIGEHALKLLLSCLKDAYRIVRIQVTEENEAAYRLYCKLGFGGDEELMEYWY